MKKEFQERIDEYLLKRMSSDDRMVFDNEVAENQELQEQLSFTEEVRHAIKSRNEKLAKMKEWEKESYSKPRLSNRRLYYWVSGIAALFIVGMITISTYLSSFYKNVGSEYVQTDSLCSQNTDDEYAFIEKLLAENEYTKALKQIETEIFEISYALDCGGIVEETDILDTVTIDSACIDNDKNINDNTWEINQSRLAHLHWLEARALIGLNRIDDALLLLEELRQSGSIYEPKADSLYRLLKR